MIKYTGEKKYEKAVIAAVEDWLRYHLPAGSTGVKLYEVELLDLDGCDIKAKVNYDINYSGIYEDEFENVTDEISFETDRAICDTFRESLQAEDEDGWGEQIEEELAQSLDFAADIAYEVRNCVRGSYVIDGDKVEDLVKSLRSLVDGLEIAIENIESDAKSINEYKSIKEAPDSYGLPTDAELEAEYQAKLDRARSERDLLQNAHEQELFDSSFLEELEDWLKKFTDMNKDSEYVDIVKNNPDLFNCRDFDLGNLIDTHKKAITWLTYAIKALKGNKYYYHKWAGAPFVYYTGGYGSPVGLVRRNVKAIFKEIPSYFSHLVDLVNGFHRVAYARGGGNDGGYSKVLTALISDERVDYKVSTFEKFKEWLSNNGIFIKQRYNFKYNQASWNEFIVTGINNSDIQLNRLKSFDSICAKFDSEFPGWTLHFSRIQNGSDRGKIRGSFSRGDKQYTNYTDTDYENDIVADDTVKPATIKSNADVNNANIVTIVKDSGKLRAQADDGEHGVAFVAFPNNLRNTEGQRYKVDKLIWNGKNYRASGNIEAINESKYITEDKYSRDLAKRLKSLTNGDEGKKSSDKNKGKKIATWKVVQTSGARLTVADDFLSEYEAAKYVEEHGGAGKLKVVKNDSVNESKSINEDVENLTFKDLCKKYNKKFGNKITVEVELNPFSGKYELSVCDYGSNIEASKELKDADNYIDSVKANFEKDAMNAEVDPKHLGRKRNKSNFKNESINEDVEGKPKYFWYVGSNGVGHHYEDEKTALNVYNKLAKDADIAKDLEVLKCLETPDEVKVVKVIKGPLVNESKSIKESTKKSYVFSKNKSKYSLNSK